MDESGCQWRDWLQRIVLDNAWNYWDRSLWIKSARYWRCPMLVIVMEKANG